MIMFKNLLRIGLIACALSIVTACDKDGDIVTPPENPESPEEPEDPIEPETPAWIDLSADELANCYIVQAPGIYRFAADNQFNLGENLPVPPSITVDGARLVWQTVEGSITSVNIVDVDSEPYVEFEVANAEGNALIAVVDENNVIQWNWHIWMPSEEISSVTSENGYEVMNMNLGAMNNTPGDAASYGLLYQWGRKDPFPASATLTGTTTTVSAPMFDIDGNEVLITNSSWASVADNTLAYATTNPTVCLSNYSQYGVSRDWLKASDSDGTLWGNSKTCYDPSPAGWRVAPRDVFAHFTSTGGYAWTFDDFNIADINDDGILDIDDYNYGWHFMVNATTPLYFPAAARFDGSYAMLMGSMSGLWGSYWSCESSASMAGGAMCALSFQVKDQTGKDAISISPSGTASRADAYSIRCIRDL